MKDLATALDEIRACRVSGESKALSTVLTELESIVLTVERWPRSFFDGLKELLQNDDFLKLDDSWKIVRFIDNNWEQLSGNETKELRDVLVASFDKHRDWMGAFVIAEILGQRYADEEAVVSLSELADRAQLPARALVPHGLESVVRAAKDEHIRSLARRKLKELALSDVKEVREEALQSLQRIDRK